jgi:phospholipase/carboxylesterase
LAWQPRLQILHKGGKGPPNFMLLHGYGSAAEHWLPYTQTIPFPPQGQFLFPQAPETVARPDGLLDGHAWWNLNLAAHRRIGRLGVDLTNEDPQGLEQAAKLVRKSLAREGNSKVHPFVLGGFSQGAMVACEVAFSSDEPLAALVILSGTPLDRAGWRPRMAMRRGMPVFMSHGHVDEILPFDLAERLREDIVAAGMELTFIPFDGGHEIPEEVVRALGEFLARIVTHKEATKTSTDAQVGASTGAFPLRSP